MRTPYYTAPKAKNRLEILVEVKLAHRSLLKISFSGGIQKVM